MASYALWAGEPQVAVEEQVLEEQRSVWKAVGCRGGMGHMNQGVEGAAKICSLQAKGLF